MKNTIDPSSSSPGGPDLSKKSSAKPSVKLLLITLFGILCAAGILIFAFSYTRADESSASSGAPSSASHSSHSASAGSAGGGGESAANKSSPSSEKKVLYWYDPMYPGTRFDKPGKSPFMDMDLVPRYEEAAAGEGITIDPSQLQNLGLKTVLVKLGKLSFSRDFPADVEFNSYQKAVIQPRAEGFVSKVIPKAVGDRVEAGETLAIVTVPGWAADQSEYLLLKSQNAGKSIIEGVREKLRLSGMPEEMLASVDSTNKIQTELSVITPVSGVITELSVYPGMNVDKSMTLAVVQGTDPAWVTAFVPEKDLHLTSGRARVTLPAFPDRAFEVLETLILPNADPATRSVPVRFTVANPERLLKPGLLATVRLRYQGQEGLIIPTQSLIDLGDEQRVILLKDDGSFLPQKVVSFHSSGDQTLISEGLKAGDKVVSAGLFLIDSEANLRGALTRLSGIDMISDAGSYEDPPPAGGEGPALSPGEGGGGHLHGG